MYCVGSNPTVSTSICSVIGNEEPDTETRLEKDLKSVSHLHGDNQEETVVTLRCWLESNQMHQKTLNLHITGDKHIINADRAKRLGINVCIEKLGREFVRAHRNSAIYAYGINQSVMYCFVGVDDKPQKGTDKLMLDSVSKWPYQVSCNVDLETEAITLIECVVKE